MTVYGGSEGFRLLKETFQTKTIVFPSIACGSWGIKADGETSKSPGGTFQSKTIIFPSIGPHSCVLKLDVEIQEALLKAVFRG
jgi:hypothetical protein